MGAFYRIVEWSKHQHYKDRDPPWIKLHRDLLTSQTWVMLSDASRVLAIACMLVAAGTDNKIPPGDYMKRRAYLHKDPDFKPLVDVGFLELVNDDNAVADASNTLADASKALAIDTECSSERETEERQRREEEEESAFAAFGHAAGKHGWPEPAKLSADRRKKLRARLDEHGLDGWKKMLEAAKRSHFLNNTFPLKFDWVLEPKNFRKVIEGNYEDKTPPKTNGKPDALALPAEEPWEQRMYGWDKAKFWRPQDWGPKPGESGCRAPKHLINTGGTA